MGDCTVRKEGGKSFVKDIGQSTCVVLGPISTYGNDSRHDLADRFATLGKDRSVIVTELKVHSLS